MISLHHHVATWFASRISACAPQPTQYLKSSSEYQDVPMRRHQLRRRLHGALGVVTLFISITAQQHANAQDTLLAWNTTGNSGITTDPYAATNTNINMQASALNRGSGLTAGSLNNGYSSSAWNGPTNLAEAATADNYIEFVAEPSNGYSMSLDKISMEFRTTETGPMTFQWQYSFDGFATTGTSIGSPTTRTNYGSGTQTDEYDIDLSDITALQSTAQTVTFRMFGWNASNSSGTGAFGTSTGDNLTLSGTTQSAGPANPVSFSATSASDTQISLSWTPNGAGDDVMVAYTSTGTFGSPADGTSYAVSDSIPGGGTVIYNGSGTSHNHTNLDAETTYYYRAWSVDGSTTYSSGISDHATTDPIPAPTANAATAIGVTNFTANWTTVVGATGYRIDVSTNDSFVGASTTAVGWDFDDDELTATTGLAVNLNQELSNVGAGAIGSITRSTGNLAASANGWDSGDGVKYWQVFFDASGVAQLTVSSVQRSSGTGPRDFKLQYRIGVAGTWIDVAGGTVQTANDYTSGVLTEVALPAAADNQPAVYLRWIMTSNTSVDNGTVGGIGTSAIDDIIIAGNMLDFILGYANRAVPSQATDSLVVTGLVSNTEHHYRVRATSDTSTSAHSGKQSTTTLVIPSPTLEEASSVESDRFAANWSTVLEADGYLLDVSTNSQFATFLVGFEDLDVGLVTSHTVTGLVASTLYYYRLRAYDVGSTSANSSTQSVSTIIKPEPTNHPTGFTASTVTHRTIILNWTDSIGEIIPDGYLIRGSTNSFDEIPIPVDGTNVPNDENWSSGLYAYKVGPNAQTLRLTGLDAEQDYYFRIYPYANQFSNIDYKTDGTVLSLAVTTDVAPWEDMEDATKQSYTTGTVDLKSGTWLFDDALLGIDTNDKRRDQRSARIRDQGSISMEFDVEEIGYLTLEYASFGSDSSGSFRIDLSTDSGVSWTAVSGGISTSSEFQTATVRIQRQGTLRFRIVRISDDKNRINIDNIDFGPFVHEPTVIRFR